MQTHSIEAIDLRSLPDEEMAELNAFNNALRAETTPEDPPAPVDVTIASYRNIPDYVELRDFVVRTSGGERIADGEAAWASVEENTHMVQAEIRVLSGHRRRGIGTELLRRVVEVAENEGRTLIIGGTTDRIPAGEAFALRVGAEPAIREHTNRLVLADVDREMIARWIGDGPSRAPGYSLVTVDGPYPDDLIDEVVDLHQVMNTAPREDLDMEDWKLTVDQMRAEEKRTFAAGGERWYVAARHDATGRLVGFTELFYNAKSQPNTFYQGGTAVRPEHRGHALGKWLKAVNLERLMRERPAIVDVRTGNADSNDAMLGINKALGFAPYISHTGWQVRVEKVKEYLDARA